MINLLNCIKKHFFLFIALCSCLELSAQKTIVSGTIKDKNTNAPLSFISVSFEGSTVGMTTDDNGHYYLSTEEPVKKLRVSAIGYEELSRPVKTGTEQKMDILLEEKQNLLGEVAVQSNNTPRYRNKNNPAVDLIRLVTEHKEANHTPPGNYTSFEQYTKLQLALSQPADRKKHPLRRYRFIMDNLDSTTLPGKALFPMFLEERLALNQSQKQPANEKVTLLGEKKTRVDKFIDNEGLEAYLEKIYQEIDPYDNNILIGDQQFLSPIAGLAPSFYKYYITDTLKEQSPQLVKVYFVPRNKADMLFKGELLVTLDGRYAVKQIDLAITRDINLNWINDFTASLQYEGDSTGHYHLTGSKMTMDMSIFKGKGGLYGEKTISIRDYTSSDKPLPVKQSLVTGNENPEQTEEFWAAARHEPLSKADQKAGTNLDSLQKTRSFRRTMDIATFLLSGYKELGPVEVGPFNSFYSFNPVEGFRLRFGGRTTEEFSKKIFLEAHAAYGFKDERWKYSAGVSYSLTRRSIYQYPVKSITVRYSNETQIPGQELAFLEEDNFLLSFKRGKNDKWFYNKKWTIDYLHEMENHFSFRLGYKYSIIEPAGALRFQPAEQITRPLVPELTVSEISGEVRWAPNEQFYQGKKYRRPIINKFPVMTLRATAGFKGFLGGAYNYQSLTLNIYKRIYLSQLGYTDMILEGGKVFGSVPYPLLAIHKANQTYSYQLGSYNLMNFMEFASDHYVSLNLDHSFNGFILNKIPLVKKLQLREMVAVKILYGGISNENNPAHHKELFRLPEAASGIPYTYSLDKMPYVEASVGISNIFKLLRVELVKRFTYLDHPNVSEWGVRTRIYMGF